MFAALLFAAALASGVPEAVALSSESRAVIAPISASIAKTRAEHARLPAPKDDVDKLLRMKDLEQAPRLALGQIDFSRIPPAELKAARDAVWAEISPIDKANQEQLLAMLPPEGWFTISRYGRPAAKSAFLIVQHADIELQRRFLPLLEKLVTAGEVEGGDYALMFDRVAMREDRPQRYGSQFLCKAGRWTPYTLEDPAVVETRRASVGLSSFSENMARFAAMPPC